MKKAIKLSAIGLAIALSVTACSSHTKYQPNDPAVNHESDTQYHKEGDSAYYKFTKKIEFQGFSLLKQRTVALDKTKLMQIKQAQKGSENKYIDKLLSDRTEDVVFLRISDPKFGNAIVSYKQNVSAAEVRVKNKNDIFKYVDYTQGKRPIYNTVYGLTSIKYLSVRALANNPDYRTGPFITRDKTKYIFNIQSLVDKLYPGVFTVESVMFY